MPEPDADGFVSLPAPIDLALTLAPIAHGRGDPTIRFAPTESGARPARRPARRRSGCARSRVALQSRPGDRAPPAAVDGAADLVGANDDPSALTPQHRLIGELVRRFPGLRLPRTNRPFEALLPAICEQKVAGVEARAAFRGIIAAHGEPAPGPGGLRLPPAAATLAALLLRLPSLRARAPPRRPDSPCGSGCPAPRDRHAGRGQRAHGAVPGIGPWTLAEVGRIAFGDPDAMSVGDYRTWWLGACPPAGPTTRACSSCWSRIAASAGACSDCSRRYGLQPRMAPQPIAGDLTYR